MNLTASRYFDGWHDALDTIAAHLTDPTARDVIDRLRFAGIATATEHPNAPHDSEALDVAAAGALVQTLLDHAMDDADTAHAAVTAAARQAVTRPAQAAEALTLLALLTAWHIRRNDLETPLTAPHRPGGAE